MEFQPWELEPASLIKYLARTTDRAQLIRQVQRTPGGARMGAQGIAALLDRFHADRLAFVNAALRGEREAAEKRAAWLQAIGEDGMRRWKRAIAKEIDRILGAHSRPAWRLKRGQARVGDALASHLGGPALRLAGGGFREGLSEDLGEGRPPLHPLVVLALGDAPGLERLFGPGSHAMWSLGLQAERFGEGWSFATGDPVAGPAQDEPGAMSAVGLTLIPFEDVPHPTAALGLPEIRTLLERDPYAPTAEHVYSRCAKRHGDMLEKVGGHVSWDNIDPSPHGRDGACDGPYVNLVQVVIDAPDGDPFPCTLYRCETCAEVWSEAQNT